MTKLEKLKAAVYDAIVAYQVELQKQAEKKND